MSTREHPREVQIKEDTERASRDKLKGKPLGV